MMAGSGKIRVGVVGLSPNRGFASIAHIPALHALSDFEIAAVCTTRQESTDAAPRHFGIPLAFSNAEDLARPRCRSGHRHREGAGPLSASCGGDRRREARLLRMAAWPEHRRGPGNARR